MEGFTISEFPPRFIKTILAVIYWKLYPILFSNIDFLFQQMVIENAREKILSNKSLQEKLAENINKFLTR